MMSFVRTPEALADLRKAVADYFARRVDEEIDRLWAFGELTDAKVESFRHLHERTPYN